eukprot:2485247-Rhodomonas_salina.2
MTRSACSGHLLAHLRCDSSAKSTVKVEHFGRLSETVQILVPQVFQPLHCGFGSSCAPELTEP